MSDATILTIVFAIIAAIPPTIASWAAYKKSIAASDKTDVLADKTDKLAVATEEISTAVNGNLEKMKAELKTANDQNTALQAMIGQLMKVIAPIAKNGSQPTFPPATDATDAAVERIVAAVEAKVVAEPTVESPVESKKLTITDGEAAKVVITKEEPK